MYLKKVYFCCAKQNSFEWRAQFIKFVKTQNFNKLDWSGFLKYQDIYSTAELSKYKMLPATKIW